MTDAATHFPWGGGLGRRHPDAPGPRQAASRGRLEILPGPSRRRLARVLVRRPLATAGATPLPDSPTQPNLDMT
eukprot:8632744-Pyramimonas_sp.AAC.1